MSKDKVNLTVLKRMVAELESSLATAESVKTDADKLEWIVELNKATGLAAGVMTEAGLLMGDIQYLIQGGAGSANKSQEFLEKIIGGLKGPGSTN